jgi:hypothetical protein
MVPLFNPAGTIPVITPLTRITIDILTKSIPNRRILQRQIRLTLRTRQSMMAAEMDIGAIPTQAQRATPAALAPRNVARTATLDLRLPAAALDQEAARLRVRIPHLLVPVRHRPDPQTQAAVRPDQAPVLRRSRLRLSQLPHHRLQHRIQMQVPLDRQNKRFTLTQVEQCASGLLGLFPSPPLFYTALRAKRSRPGTKTA